MIWIPAALIATPFLLAAVLLAGRQRARWAGPFALFGPLTATLLGIWLWRQARPGQVVLLSQPWIPSLGIAADVRVDRLGAFFVLLIGVIGLAVFQYARVYLGPRADRGFWALMLAFTGAMLGIVLVDHLVLLYVFWELTTITSGLLIARASHEEQARSGALQAFLVTAAGGLALLAGIVLLGQLAGTYRLSELAQAAPALVADPRHRLPLLLVLAGALTKSAQVPFHFWLPAAMAAPAPVSAYLHSATMVKAGVFLVARLFPIFSESPLWFPLLTTFGLASFIVGGWSALVSDDVKKLLAYSTVAYLGLLTAHYGTAGRVGLRGELVSIANHALYKSALFLLVGWVEKATGTRDLRTLARERWPPHEPVGTALFGLGALAMAGSPLLLGFVAKELFLETVVGAGWVANLPQVVVVVTAAALTVAYGLKIFTAMLFGSETPPPDRRKPGALSRWLLGIPALLLLPQLIGGIAPRWLLAPLLQPDQEVPPGPAVWRHADVLLTMSLASFALGTVLFLVWRPLGRKVRAPDFERLVGAAAGATVRAAAWLGRSVQAGGHPRFAVWILLGSIGAMLAGAYWKGLRQIRLPAWGPEWIVGWAPAVATVTAAVLVVVMRRRTAKAVMIAIVGYGVAFYYVLFRAPDLVLTQILVETVSLVLLLLVFRRMPRLDLDPRPPGTRAAHLAVAVLVGAALTAITWTVADTPALARAGDEHLARALPEAHGRNVVNVILVDFRGADTLGEIIVLAIAALGVVALGRTGAPAAPPAPGGGMGSLILSRVGQLLFPITVIFALYLLLRGHDEPGGGFSAGVVTVLTIVIQAFAFGVGWTRARLHRIIRPAFALGLCLAFGTALAPVLAGQPFFTHYHADLRLPGGASLSLGTTLLFDLGVYATVVGTTAVALSAIADREATP